MEIGYDYSLSGGFVRRRPWFLPVSLSIVLAVILFSTIGGYYTLRANVQDDAAVTDSARTGLAAEVRPTTQLHLVKEQSGFAGYTGPRIPAPESAIAGQQLYPAGLSQAVFWVNPMAYEPSTEGND